MSTVDDMGRLRDTEQEAQEIVAQAKEHARQLRRETEERVAALGDSSADDLAAMRERVQAEIERETDEMTKASRTRVEEVTSEIYGRLTSLKPDAVKVVVEALVTL